MMKYLKLIFSVSTLFAVMLFSSCGDDDGVQTPLSEGTSITVRNTFEETGQPETVYATFFGLSEDALDLTASISNNTTEFPNALAVNTSQATVAALYSINITTTTIEYTLLPEVGDDPFWDSNFRVLEAGTYDRYYFTFDEPHNIGGFTSSDNAINVRIDSDQVIVVEIGEGFNFMPGASFTINLN